MKRFSLRGLLRRQWMVIVAVVVVALAGFAVDRLHDAFGSKRNSGHGGDTSNEIDRKSVV